MVALATITSTYIQPGLVFLFHYSAQREPNSMSPLRNGVDSHWYYCWSEFHLNLDNSILIGLPDLQVLLVFSSSLASYAASSARGGSDLPQRRKTRRVQTRKHPLRKPLSLFVQTRRAQTTLTRNNLMKWRRARNLITPPLTTPSTPHNIMTTSFLIRPASPPLSTTSLLSCLPNHKTTRGSTTNIISLLHLKCMPLHRTTLALTRRLVAPALDCTSRHTPLRNRPRADHRMLLLQPCPGDRLQKTHPPAHANSSSIHSLVTALNHKAPRAQNTHASYKRVRNT